MKTLVLFVVLTVVRTNLYAATDISNEDLMYSSLTHKGREVSFEKCGTTTHKKEFKIPKPKKFNNY